MSMYRSFAVGSVIVAVIVGFAIYASVYTGAKGIAATPGAAAAPALRLAGQPAAAAAIPPAVAAAGAVVPSVSKKAQDTPWEVTSRSGPIWVIIGPEDARTILAEVNGSAISRADVKRRVKYLAQIATAQARLQHQPLGASLRPAEANVLDQLIGERLLLSEADERGVALTPEDARARAEMLRGYNRQPAVFRMDPPDVGEFDKFARSRRMLAVSAGGDQPETERVHMAELLKKASITRPAEAIPASSDTATF